jgi:hypothetical protein
VGYTFALLLFSVAGALLTCAVERLQNVLPFNPQGLGAGDDEGQQKSSLVPLVEKRRGVLQPNSSRSTESRKYSLSPPSSTRSP